MFFHLNRIVDLEKLFLKDDSIYLFIFGCAGLSLHVAFSSYREQGLLSVCGAWATVASVVKHEL